MRIVVRFIQLAVITVLFAATTAAQGIFLEQGEHGLGFEGGALWGNIGSGSMGVLGYCNERGQLSVGLESFREDGVSNSSQVGSVELDLIARQNNSELPLGMVVRLGYRHSLNTVKEMELYYFGASVYRNQSLSTDLFIQPRLGFAGGELYVTERRSFDVTGFLDASLKLAYKPLPRLMIVSGPGVSYNTDAKVSVWGFSVAVILITRK